MSLPNFGPGIAGEHTYGCLASGTTSTNERDLGLPRCDTRNRDYISCVEARLLSMFFKSQGESLELEPMSRSCQKAEVHGPA
jgi:hypothetical protein